MAFICFEFNLCLSIINLRKKKKIHYIRFSDFKLKFICQNKGINERILLTKFNLNIKMNTN